MPDSVGFYSDLSGRENLRYTARLNRIERDDAEAAIDEVLEQVGLTGRADDSTETYSRGMLQRLGIADALVKDPDVLILDEPTTAIDPLGVTEILELDRKSTRLNSSHVEISYAVFCLKKKKKTRQAMLLKKKKKKNIATQTH